MQYISGGVCAAKGFLASGLHCGIAKKANKKDLALIYSPTPCHAAGVTTQNKVRSAPVLLTIDHLQSGTAQAIIANSGNANACTPNAMEVATKMSELAAQSLGLQPQQVLVASTGVIGQPMDIAPIERNIHALAEQLSENGNKDCMAAILTTDLVSKESAVRFVLGEKECTIGGICKGSGMIHPNMATLLSFLTTDVAISSELLQKALKQAVFNSFNMISVDRDTSTNDTALLLSNGEANNPMIQIENEDYQLFFQALESVCIQLAKQIAADGEGASKLVECDVTGANSQSDARALAKSVICSPLLKAAMFGSDANWGRILCALGYAGVDFDPQAVSVSFVSSAGSLSVCKNGEAVPFSEEKAKSILSQKEITILVSVGNGNYQATAWGCDLTYDYVKINGDYRS